MIIEFTVKNFRSFKDEATLSLEAAPLRSGEVDTIKTDVATLLPAVGVFGPNASGKSTLIKALSFMQGAVQNTDLSSPTTKNELLKPFLLDKNSSKKPSFFQIVLWDKESDSEYRYGFEINSKNVVSEWLDVSAKESSQRRRRAIFRREGQDFTFHRSMSKEFRPRAAQVNPEGLALATFAFLNSELAKRIVSIMSEPNIVIFDGATDLNFRRALERCRSDATFKNKVLSFVQQAGLGVQDLTIDEEEMPKEILKYFSSSFKKQLKQGGHELDTILTISTVHKMRGRSPKEQDSMVTFSLQRDESLGTQRFIVLAALVLESLEKGAVFVLDELGASLHPFLTGAIVNLFQDHKTNKKNAQLIFCSHETYLLSKRTEMRRDQVWFTDINFYEESSLHSLVEYKTRNDFEVAKNYLEGRFDALPVTRFSKDK
jgi:AAA15 family ATPase/GTPase